MLRSENVDNGATCREIDWAWNQRGKEIMPNGRWLPKRGGRGRPPYSSVKVSPSWSRQNAWRQGRGTFRISNYLCLSSLGGGLECFGGGLDLCCSGRELFGCDCGRDSFGWFWLSGRAFPPLFLAGGVKGRNPSFERPSSERFEATEARASCGDMAGA
jgi:hypothetical protein